MDYTEDYHETFDLLEDLTEEELLVLNQEFDPENNLLPIHERVNYECEKQPSRFYNRTQLTKHLETALNFGGLVRPSTHPKPMEEKIKAAESKIGKDYVPFVKKEVDYSNHTLNVPGLKPIPKARSPSPLPNLTEDEITSIEAAAEDELVEIAAQLKMNDLITTEQIEQIRAGKKPIGTGILRPTLVRPNYPQKSFSIDEDDADEEYVDVDAMVKAMRSKGEDISIIVCNNQPYMDPEVLEEIAAHLMANKNIRHLSLANCNFSDSCVESFSEALANNTKLETLNLESNFITPVGVKKLLDAIQDSKSLREIRLENQYSKIGPKCEAEMAAAMENNFTMLNFGYSFETRGPRDAMNRYMLRNNDLLRAARRNGENIYDLPKQKRIIAKFRPPWILRRPKRRGDSETFEGRKYVMKGDSKKKKKKGPAMMNEMLAKAAQVSERWKEKEQTGELHSELERIEYQSKINVEDRAAESKGRRRGRNRQRENGDMEEEGDGENEVVENGEVEGQRRDTDMNGEAEGMGAARRRRGRRGDDEDMDDDEDRRRRRGGQEEDEADGKRGRGKMDAETRRRAMRGGKVVEEDRVGLGAANRRRNRGNNDDEEEGIDLSQYEVKSDDDAEEENDQNKANDVSSGKSKGPRIPKGLKLGEQPVAQMDNASMRMRRSKRTTDDDEAMDLDEMLKSTGEDEKGDRKRKGEGDSDEENLNRRRRRRRRSRGEGDDMSGHDGEDDDDDDDEMCEENDKDGTKGSRIPTGKSLKTQPVANLETVSMKNRRRRKVDDDAGESLDDLLKSVETKGDDQDAEDDLTMDEEEERKRALLEKSRRGSDVKLPTGRKLSVQKVAQLEAVSFKDRRKKKTYDDDEENIDALLDSVPSAEEEERRRAKGKQEQADGDDSSRVRRRRKAADDEGEDLDSMLAGVPKKEDGRAEEETPMDESGEDELPGQKGARIPKGRKLTDQKTQALEAVSFKDRRRKKATDEEDEEDFLAGTEKNEVEEDSMGEDGGSRGSEGRSDRRRAGGKKLAGQETGELGAASMRGRRRRRGADDDEAENDSKQEDEEDIEDKNDASSSKEKRGPRIPKGLKLADQPTRQLSTASLRDRRRKKDGGDGEDVSPEKSEEEEEESEEEMRRGSSGKMEAKKGPRIPKGDKLANQKAEALGAVTLKGRRRQVIKDEEEDIDSVLAAAISKKEDEEPGSKEEAGDKGEEGKGKGSRVPKGIKVADQPKQALGAMSRRKKVEDEEEDIDSLLSSTTETKKEEEKPTEDEISDDESMPNGYQEDIAAERERRRQKQQEIDDELDPDKKRELRRKQREEELAAKKAKEKPAPVEEKKAPEPKKIAPAIKVPDRPPVDLTKPMSLRERRRLKEQGLL